MPFFWQWFFAVVGMVAFVMAVQPFLQFIWGRAKTTVELCAQDKTDRREMVCTIYNLPIDNNILKFLRLERDSINALSAAYTINDLRTKSTIATKEVSKLTTAREEDSYQVSLPSCLTPVGIYLMQADSNGKTTLQNGTSIKPGKYEMVITILYDGKTHIEKKNFFVGDKTHELFWEETKS